MTVPAQTPTTASPGPAGLNWARNLAYAASRFAEPTSVQELQQLVAEAPQVSALGSRHSFTRIADTPGLLVSVAQLPGSVTVTPAADGRSGIAFVPAGMRYAEVARALDAQGWALGAMASLPHISIAGAIATGTHGSGDAAGSLATAVVGLELVRSDGSLATIRRGDEGFDGAVVSLGALGIVVRVELEVEPSYAMTQVVDLDLPWDSALADLDAVMGSATSVSLFTNWSRSDLIDQVWRKSRVTAEASGAPAPLDGSVRAGSAEHPLRGQPAPNCTDQSGEPGPWFERLPHFRAEFTPSNGDELQSEYFVPRSHAVAALSAMRTHGPAIEGLLQVSEVRSIRGDDLWLSGASGGDVIGIHFTWMPDERAVRAALPGIESVLEPFGARPHWGKVFTMDPAAVAARYPRWESFRALRADWDPRGALRGPLLQHWGV